MPSSNIVGLTALAVPQPTMLMYAGISPFGVTDDRKITADALLSTITAAIADKSLQFDDGQPTATVSAAGKAKIRYNNLTGTFQQSINGAAYADFGSGGMVIGGTVTGGTTGSVLFVGAGPVLAQDNANLFWDDTNNRLGLGTASPGALLHVNGIARLGTVSATTGQLQLANSASANLTTIQAGNAAAARTYTWPLDFGAAGSVLTDAAGNGTLSWAAGGGSGTVNAGTANQLAYYPASAAAVSGNAALVIGSGFALNVIQPDNADSTGLAVFANNLSQHSVLGWKNLGSTSGSFYISNPNTTLSLGDPVQFIGSAGVIMSLDMHDGGGGSVGINYVIAAGTDGQLFVVSGAATRPVIVAKAAAAQSANIQDWRDSGNNVLAAILNNGAFSPVSLADASAANNTVYFSTNANKLVYKDGGGVVNNLY